MNRKRIIPILFFVYCILLLWLTVLSRQPRTGGRIFKHELFWSYRAWIVGESYGKAESIQNIKNILAFIPFGYLFPQRKSIIKAVLAAAFFSLFIETVQYVFNVGWCEVDDILSNAFGALIGSWLPIGIVSFEGNG